MTEYQSGDPDEPPQALVLTRQQFQLIEIITSQSKRIFKHKDATKLFSTEVIRVAQEEALAGVSRKSDEKRVAEYLRLLGLDFYDDDGKPTRYCAAGLSLAASRAYCDMIPDSIDYNDRNRLSKLRDVTGDIRSYYFLPHAQCKAMADEGKKRGQWVSVPQSPKPGWIVFFNWSGAIDFKKKISQVADHKTPNLQVILGFTDQKNIILKTIVTLSTWVSSKP